MEGDGLLKVITFSSGAQPFVVRCDQDTKVQDIVLAIAGIWGFKDAAQLFTLCRPAADCPSTADVLQLLKGATMLRGGTLLTSHDRPKPDKAPLLLIRSIFGNTPPELEQNQAVQALTAVQVAADVAIGRYPPQADANLLQHLVKQGQNSVVLQMASCWPSGACLTMGPAQVLSGGQKLQLPATVTVGLNAAGLHIMDGAQYRACMPIASIAAVAAAGDVLNISHAAGADQPDLLLQLTGAEAVADAFRVHQAADRKSVV